MATKQKDPGVNVTTDVMARLVEVVPEDCEVSGEFNQEVSAWTFTVLVPPSSEDALDGQGVSRQIVTEGGAAPTEEAVAGMVSEIANTVSVIKGAQQ